ncbi:MAG: hypothetical protein R2708_09050, partial [Vicinamibacterales bacterium]
MTTTARTWRAGQSIEDHCRACHQDRMHTVVVVDGGGQPLRVTCDYCGSEHNYRGGGRTAVAGAAAAAPPAARPARPADVPEPPVSDREIAEPHRMADTAGEPLEALLRRV